MKITTMTLHIAEEDFEQYEKTLVKMGWDQPRKHIFRKSFGNTSVEIREYLRTFGSNIELVFTFHNPNGCSIEVISMMLDELKDAANKMAADDM